MSIAGAKVYFVLTSYTVQLMLPRIFGTPSEFGLYSVAMSGVSILNNVLIVATIQSVSKFVSEDEANAPQTLRQGLRLQLLLGGTLAALLFVLAPGLARVLLDAQLTPLFRVAAVAVLSYSLYAALVGSLNGRHLFVRQAGLDATFSTLRTGGILAGATLGLGALGAIAGFASAAVAILTVASIWVGWGGRARPIQWRQWLVFMGPIWLYHICLNGTLLIDLQVLKRTVGHMAAIDGTSTELAADVANRFVGYYRAAQTFAFVPYQMIIAMTFIVFPMISRATSLGDRAAARSTIQHAMRLSLLLLISVAAPIGGSARGVMRLAYPPEYLQGASTLSVLVFGMAAFALFVVAATAISGAGRPSIAAGIAGVGVVTVVIAVRVLLGRAGVGDETLRAAALGTCFGMGVTLLLSGWVIRQLFGVFIPTLTWVRALFAGALGFLVSASVPDSSPAMAVLALAAGFAAYLLGLVVTRELTTEDWKALRGVV